MRVVKDFQKVVGLKDNLTNNNKISHNNLKIDKK